MHFLGETMVNIYFDPVIVSMNFEILVMDQLFYCPRIFTLDLPYMHEYITRSLHSIFNHRKT